MGLEVSATSMGAKRFAVSICMQFEMTTGASRNAISSNACRLAALVHWQALFGDRGQQQGSHFGYPAVQSFKSLYDTLPKVMNMARHLRRLVCLLCIA